MPTHRHRHKLSSTSSIGKNLTLNFRCKCGDERSRPATKLEQLIDRKEWKTTTDIHRVWHAFQKKFMTEGGFNFKTEGYALMVAVEQWAKRYPNDVQVTGCDDSYHSGSDLVLIEHKTENSYMGTTVVVIPQNGSPCEFFLYPGHRKDLQHALQVIALASKSIKEREHRFAVNKSKMFSRLNPE